MRILTLIFLLCFALPASAQVSLTIVTNTAGLTNLTPSATRPAVAVVPVDGSSISFWRYTPTSSASVNSDTLPTSSGTGRWLRVPFDGSATNLLLSGTSVAETFSADSGTFSALTTANGTLIPFIVTPRTNLVIVSPYDTSRAGTSYGPTSGETYFEFLTGANRYAIRQDGDIQQIKLYLSSISRLATLKFRLWRTNGVSFDWVADSEDFATSATAGAVNTFTLATPIAAKTGDFLSVAVTYSGAGANTALFQYVPKNDYVYASPSSVYSVTSSPATNSLSWTSQTALTNMAVPIEVYMSAPVYVTFGDSIASGRGVNQSSFVEGRGHILPWQPGKTYDDIISAANSWTHQNMGIASQTSTELLARFTNDVLNLKPRFVTIDCGINDGLTAVAVNTTLTNIQTMVGSAVNNGVTPVVLAITPYAAGSGSTLAIQTNRVTINDYLRTNVPLWGGRFAEVGDSLGVYFPTGPSGNLWALARELQDTGAGADGIHPGIYGNKLIAKGILEALSLLNVGAGSVTAGSATIGSNIQIGGGGVGYIRSAAPLTPASPGMDLVLEGGPAASGATNTVGGNVRIRGGASTGTASGAVRIDAPIAGSSGTSVNGYQTIAAFANNRLTIGLNPSGTPAGVVIRNVPDGGSQAFGFYESAVTGNALTNYYSFFAAPTLTVSPQWYWGFYGFANTGATNNNIGLQIDQPTSGATRNTAISIGTPATGNYAIYSGSSYDSLLTGAFRANGNTIAGAHFNSVLGLTVGNTIASSNSAVRIRYDSIPNSGEAYGLLIDPSTANTFNRYYGIYQIPNFTVSPAWYYGHYVLNATTALTNSIGIQVDQPTSGATRNTAITIGTPAPGNFAFYSASTNDSYWSGKGSFVGLFTAADRLVTGSTLTVGNTNFQDINGIHVRYAFPVTNSAVYTVQASASITNQTGNHASFYANPTITTSPPFNYGLLIPAASGATTNNIGIQVDQPTSGATRSTAIAIGTPATGQWAFFSTSSSPSALSGPLRMGGSTGPLWTSGTGSPEGVVTAPIGSFYSRTDGGAGTSWYVKESGTGNTGWVGK